MQQAHRALAVLGLLYLLAAAVLPWFGPAPVNVAAVMAGDGPERMILIKIRIPRTLLGLLAGGCLGLAGAVFQALLRESLATPYTLGIASGASFAVALAAAAGAVQWLGLPASWLAALAGSAAVTLLVAAIGSAGGKTSSLRMLLAGISLNAVFSAGTLAVMGAAREHRTAAVAQWLIGSVDAVRPPALLALAAVAVVGLAVLLAQARALNLMAMGEEWAATRGARPGSLLWLGFSCASLLTAAVVSLCGPIGFVGLIVPHLVRSSLNADHRVLLPGCFLGGGLLLAVADAIARTAAAPAELPTGTVMAFIGGPYLIWAVWRRF
jgi:iron complex transport system permease protein